MSAVKIYWNLSQLQVNLSTECLEENCAEIWVWHLNNHTNVLNETIRMLHRAEMVYFNSMQIAKPTLFSFFVLCTKWQRPHDITSFQQHIKRENPFINIKYSRRIIKNLTNISYKILLSKNGARRVLKNEIHICRNSCRKCSQTILTLIL
jgi:hypothetical protein